MLSIKALKLPHGLGAHEEDTDKFIKVFRQRLKIIWHNVSCPDGVMRI